MRRPSGRGRDEWWAIFDTILIGLAVGLSALVPIFAIAMLGSAPLGTGLELVLVFLVVTVVAVVASRPALRLPSRVLGDPISWAQAWRLGKGNTLALVLGPFLISLPILLVEQIVQPGAGDAGGRGEYGSAAGPDCAHLRLPVRCLRPAPLSQSEL